MTVQDDGTFVEAVTPVKQVAGRKKRVTKSVEEKKNKSIKEREEKEEEREEEGKVKASVVSKRVQALEARTRRSKKDVPLATDSASDISTGTAFDGSAFGVNATSASTTATASPSFKAASRAKKVTRTLAACGDASAAMLTPSRAAAVRGKRVTRGVAAAAAVAAADNDGTTSYSSLFGEDEDIAGGGVMITPGRVEAVKAKRVTRMRARELGDEIVDEEEDEEDQGHKEDEEEEEKKENEKQKEKNDSNKYFSKFPVLANDASTANTMTPCRVSAIAAKRVTAAARTEAAAVVASKTDIVATPVAATSNDDMVKMMGAGEGDMFIRPTPVTDLCRIFERGPRALKFRVVAPSTDEIAAAAAAATSKSNCTADGTTSTTTLCSTPPPPPHPQQQQRGPITTSSWPTPAQNPHFAFTHSAPSPSPARPVIGKRRRGGDAVSCAEPAAGTPVSSAGTSSSVASRFALSTAMAATPGSAIGGKRKRVKIMDEQEEEQEEEEEGGGGGSSSSTGQDERGVLSEMTSSVSASAANIDNDSATPNRVKKTRRIKGAVATSAATAATPTARVKRAAAGSGKENNSGYTSKTREGSVFYKVMGENGEEDDEEEKWEEAGEENGSIGMEMVQERFAVGQIGWLSQTWQGLQQRWFAY